MFVEIIEKVVSGKKVTALAELADVKASPAASLYYRINGTVYNPLMDYKPVGGGQRAYAQYVDAFGQLAPEAQAAAEALHNELTASAPVAQAPASGNDLLMAALQQAVASVAAGDIEQRLTSTVCAAADAYIANTYGILPQRLEIVKQDKSVAMTGIFHAEFTNIVNYLSAGIPVLLTGPAGTGKSYIARQAAQALDVPFFESNAVTQEYKVSGYMDAHGVYQQTPFYTSFKNGGVFLLDEIDASIPEVLVLLNDALANGEFTFPNGEFVKVSPDFYFIATANTFGTGADSEYCGRYQLDAATLDRFAAVVIDYDNRLELALVDNDSQLVDFAHAFRAACKECGINHLFTYRALKNIYKASKFLSLEKTLQQCLTKNLSNDDISVIVNAIIRENGSSVYTDALKSIAGR